MLFRSLIVSVVTLTFFACGTRDSGSETSSQDQQQQSQDQQQSQQTETLPEAQSEQVGLVPAFNQPMAVQNCAYGSYLITRFEPCNANCVNCRSDQLNRQIFDNLSCALKSCKRRTRLGERAFNLRLINQAKRDIRRLTNQCSQCSLEVQSLAIQALKSEIIEDVAHANIREALELCGYRVDRLCNGCGC